MITEQEMVINQTPTLPSCENEKKVDIEMLNNLALERADRYTKLHVGNVFVNTPFFINQMQLWLFNAMQNEGVPYDQIMGVMDKYGQSKELPYAWYKGKGSPEEIEEAAGRLAKDFGLDLERATPESAAEFLKYVGLGVDCSGFVTNCLTYAFEQAGMEGFLDSLDIIPYENGARSKNRAGVFSYIHNGASRIIKPEEVGPLDIVVREGWHDQAWHMGVILQREDYLLLAHSTLGLTPNGVHLSWFRTQGDQPVFGFKPNLSPVDWEDYYKEGKMTFRRLAFIDNIPGRDQMWDTRTLGEM